MIKNDEDYVHEYTLICEMAGVREYEEGDSVELCRDNQSQRLIIRASAECGNRYTTVDLLDLLDWLKIISRAGLAQHSVLTEKLKHNIEQNNSLCDDIARNVEERHKRLRESIRK